MSDHSRQDHTALRDLAVDLAHQAGELLRGRTGGPIATTTKSSATDLVTLMDRAAEAVVIEGLRAARPGDAILGEEGGERLGTTGVRWLVDPLDGTVNYVHGIPAYGVSIASEIDGQVVAGAVYLPAHDLMYDAALGGGARVNGSPTGCSNADVLTLSLVGTGFSYSAAERELQGQTLLEVLPAVGDIRRFGAAALDLCAVGSGQLDAFFESRLQPWDFAAGLLVATESGARTTRLTSPTGEVVVAAAPGIFEALVELLVRTYEVTDRPPRSA